MERRVLIMIGFGRRQPDSHRAVLSISLVSPHLFSQASVFGKGPGIHRR